MCPVPPNSHRSPALSCVRYGSAFARRPYASCSGRFHRLRALALRASDFVRMATYHRLERHMDSTSRTLFEGLRDSLKEEPVVKEDEERRLR